MCAIEKVLVAVLAGARSRLVTIFKACSVAVSLLVPLAVTATAEPATLKLSFFTSDRSKIYQYSVKPFVDAVNREGRGVIRIVPKFSDPLTKVQVDQPHLVANDTIDMAIFAPGLLPDQFSDTAVMELPGLYKDSREAGLVYTRLVQADALKGYDKYFTIGAFVSPAESIHSRVSILANKDLKGLTIRTNNDVEADVLSRFGAKARRMSINQATEAISRGTIDGATFPPSVLFEFGIGRLTPYHYMLKLGGAPNVLIMNRKKFESLPPRAQAIIRKHSGEWLVERSASAFEALDKATIARLESDPRRKVVFPSPADTKSAQRIFEFEADNWAAQSPHNRALLALVKFELAKVRSAPGSKP